MFTGLGGERLWLCPSLNDSANDISGNGNNGSYQGGLTTIINTDSGGSRAYNINFTSKYIDCGNILDALSQFTISAWVNRNGRTDATGIAGKWNGTGYMLYNSTASVAIDAGPHLAGSQLPTYGWEHLTATYDGTTIRLYQNGVETGSQVHAAPSSTTATYQIGAYVGSGFRSLLDDIRQYSRVLSQAEISHLASARGVQGSPYRPLTLKSRVTRLLSNRAATLLERIRSASKPTTPISIKVKHNEEPSYKAGYAKNADESENPHLWDGLTGAWVPNLGIGSGLKIKNLAVKNDEGDLKNDIEWSQKGMIQNDADQYVLLPDGYVNTEGTVIGSIDPIGVYSHFRSHQVWNSRNWIVEISSVGGSGFIASCNKWGSSGYATVNSSSTQSDKSYTLASSFKDGDTLKLYVDGNLAGETAYSGSQTQAGWDAKIFRYSDAQPGQHNWANPYLYGPVLLYKRVLSASEIKTLSEDLLAPFRRKKSAIGYQPIKEVKGLIRT